MAFPKLFCFLSGIGNIPGPPFRQTASGVIILATGLLGSAASEPAPASSIDAEMAEANAAKALADRGPAVGSMFSLGAPTTSRSRPH